MSEHRLVKVNMGCSWGQKKHTLFIYFLNMKTMLVYILCNYW